MANVVFDDDDIEEGASSNVVTNTVGDADGSIKQGHEVGNINEGLIAYYPFENTDDDTVAYDAALDNHGTINGATPTAGKIGSNALSFDGSNDDYVNMNTQFSRGSVSISVWFYRATSGTFHTVYSEGPFGGNGAVGCHVRLTDTDNLSFTVITQSAGDSTGDDITTPAPPANEWHHAVCTYDSSTDEMQIYVNGDLRNSKTHSSGGEIYNGDYANLIGSRGWDYPAITFDGNIDELRIYERILCQQEIDALYEFGVPESDSLSEGVSQYALDGGATDSWGANDGTVNGPVFVQGLQDRAGSFDGSDDGIDVPHSSDLSLTGDWTVSGWVKPESSLSDASTAGIMAAKSETGGGRPNYSVYFATTGEIGTNYYATDGTWQDTKSQTSWTADEWHHVAGVYDESAGTLSLYVNGVKESSIDVSAEPQTYSGDLNIGYRNGSGNYLPGEIEDVRIYDTPLSQHEVKSLASEHVEALHQRRGVTREYPLDGDATDVVGGNNGTLNGDPQFVSGRSGQAIELDGTDDYVDIPNLGSLSSYTISGWIKPDGSKSSNAIIGLFNNNRVEAYWKTDGLINFIQTDSSGNNSSVVGDSPRGEWTHFAATWDGNYLQMHVNGYLVDTDTISGMGSMSSDDIIGARGSSSPPDLEFEGQMEDFLIYDRALSTEEVRRLADDGPFTYHPPRLTLPVESEDVSNGLEAEWTLDGDVSDSVGYDGEAINPPSFVSDRGGTVAEFDGTDDYVSIDSHDYGGMDSISISMWAYFNELPSTNGEPYTLIGKSDDESGTDAFYLSAGTDDTYDWRLFTGDNLLLNDVGTVKTGEWVHLTATYDGSTAELYVDGSQVGSTTGSGSINNTSAITKFGLKDIQNLSGAFNGRVDDVRIYDYALAEEDIQALYNETDTPEDGVARYELSGDLTDSWGNNNGSTGVPEFVSGRGQQVADFNGSEFVEAVNPVQGTIDDFAISAWIYPKPDEGVGVIYNIREESSPLPQLRFSHYSGDELGIRISDGAGNVTQISTDTTVPAGQWSHVTVTRDTSIGAGPAGLTLYINGTEQSTTTDVNQGTSASMDFSGVSQAWIGRRASNEMFYDGEMSEVRYYDRNLSDSEIDALYNNNSPPEDGVAKYELNGDFTDSWGANDASPPSQPAYQSGRTGQAMYFDGDSDAIDAQHITMGSAVTVSAWVKLQGGQGSYRYVIRQRDSTGNTGWNIFASNDDLWEFWTGNGSNWVIVETEPVEIDRWTHLTLTLVQNSHIKAYVNGELAGVVTDSSIDISSSESLTIGNNAIEGGNSFNGQIEDVRIYKRELTPAEVEQLYYNNIGRINRGDML